MANTPHLELQVKLDALVPDGQRPFGVPYAHMTDDYRRLCPACGEKVHEDLYPEHFYAMVQFETDRSVEDALEETL